jgi:hypothetical protein
MGWWRANRRTRDLDQGHSPDGSMSGMLGPDTLTERRRADRRRAAHARPGSNHAWWLTALVVATALTAVPVLVRLSRIGAQSDIPVHANMAVELVEAGEWFTYSLWYPLVYVVAGGSDATTASLRWASVALLLAAVVAKVLIVYSVTWRATRSRPAALAVGVLLLLAMPLVDPWRPRNIYLGQITANVWHNSTNIFALPCAIGAFLAAAAMLRAPTPRRAAVFGGLVVLSVLTKPNYAVALLPVAGLMLLWALRQHRRGVPEGLVVVTAAFIPVTVVLAAQFAAVFAGDAASRDVDLVIAPLAVWGLYSPNVAWSVVLSIAGPALTMLVLPSSARRDPAMVLAWLVLGLAVGQMALLAEATGGAVQGSGNFLWGAYLAVFMVFLTTAVELAQVMVRGPVGGLRSVAAVAVVVLAGHAVSGAVYAARAGVDGFPVTRGHGVEVATDGWSRSSINAEYALRTREQL